MLSNFVLSTTPVVKYQFTRRPAHDQRMPTDNTQDYAKALASNTRRLMKARGWTTRDLGERAGVSQKTANNVAAGRGAATLTTLQAIARAFRVAPYVLLLPELPNGDSAEEIDTLIRRYTQADAAGREVVAGVAEQMAKYTTRT